MHIERNWILRWGCCCCRCCCCHVYGRIRVKIHMKISMNLNKLTINWLLIKIDLRIRLHFYIFYACISCGQAKAFHFSNKTGGRNVGKKASMRAKQAGRLGMLAIRRKIHPFKHNGERILSALIVWTCQQLLKLHIFYSKREKANWKWGTRARDQD